MQLLKREHAWVIRSFGHTPAALPEDRTQQDSPTELPSPHGTSTCQRHCCSRCPMSKGKRQSLARQVQIAQINKGFRDKLSLPSINNYLLHLPHRCTSARSAQTHHLACSSFASGYTGHSTLCRFHCSFYTLLYSYSVTDRWLVPRVIKQH